MKLTAKLIAVFLMLSIIPLAIVGYLAYDNARQTLEQETVRHLLSVTILKEAELERWVDDNQRSLRELARRPLIRDYATILAAYEPTSPESQKAHKKIRGDHFVPTLEEEEDWMELFLIRASDGMIVVSTNEKQEGKYRESVPYFLEGKKHTYVQNVYYSLTLEEAAMTVATPVNDREGNLVAVMAGRANLSEMSEIMQQGIDLKSTEETYLVNASNFFVTESRFAPDYTLKQTIHTEGVEDCLQHNNGAGFYDDYREVPVIGAYRWIPELELCILTEVDQSEAFASIGAARSAVMGTGVVVVLVVAILAVLFARSITRPVGELVRGTEEFGRGNLAYRIGMKARDEIGQLAGAFNAMAAQRQQVNEQVLQQNAVLDAINKVFQETLVCKTGEEVARTCLAVVEELTGSKFGFIGEVNQAGLFDTIAISYPGWDACKMPDSEATRLIKNMELRGIDRSVLREEKSRIVNDPASHPDRVGTPEGHPPITSFLGVPLKRANETTGMIGLANKESGFNLVDQQALETLSVAFVQALNSKRAEASLRESEEKYRTILENIEDGYYEVDIAGNLTFFNDSLCKLYGYSEDELMGMNNRLYMDDETAKKVYRTYHAIYRTGKPAKAFGWEVIRKDGTRRFVEVSVSPIRGSKGEPTGFRGIVRDITERKQAEEALRDSEKRFHNIFETAAVSIWEEDFSAVKAAIEDLKAQGVTDFRSYLGAHPEFVRQASQMVKVLNVNQTTLKMFGAASKPEMMGSLSKVFVPETLQILQEEIIAIAEGQTFFEGETVNQTLQGERLNILLTMAIPSEKEKFESVLVSLMDITERVRAEASLRESEEKAKAQYKGIPVPTYTWQRVDEDFILVDYNDAAVAITRGGVDKYGGMKLSDMYRDMPDIREDIWRCFTEKTPIKREMIYPFRTTGEERHLDVKYTFIPPDLVMVHTEDVTERKQAEYQLRRETDRTKALLRNANRLNAYLKLNAVLEAVCKETTASLDVSAASIYLHDEQRQLMRFAEGFNLPAEYGEKFPTMPGFLYDEISHRNNRKPIVIPDVQAIPDSNGAELMAELDIRTNVSVSLLREEQLIGALNFITLGEIRHFTEEELVLVQGLADQAALAIANARLYEETQQQAKELAVMYEETVRHAENQGSVSQILHSLNAKHDVTEAFPEVVSGLREITGCEHVSLALLDESREWVTFVALDQPGAELSQRLQLRLSDTAVTDDLLAGKPHLTPDLSAEVGFPAEQALFKAGHRSRINLPLIVGERVIGALNLTWLHQAGYAPDQVPLLQQIANALALAVQKSRLFEDARRRLQHVQTLHAIDMAITGSLDLGVILNVVLDQVTSQLGVDAANVLLLDPHTTTLKYAAGRGFHTTALQHTHLRLGEGYAGQAALERRKIHVPDLNQSPNGLERSPLLKDEQFVAYYGVPLIVKGQVQGVLEIFHRAPLYLDQELQDFLGTIASQTAIAIDNTSMFQDLQHSNLELTLAYDRTLEGWSRALELRDVETEGHSQRVTHLTLHLARAVGMSEDEFVHLRRGALLHDIGKMGIPDSILYKPGPLSDEEWKLMRQHPVSAYELLSPVPFLRQALDIPYCHHEKWDGTGYPRGLKGIHIPLAARIFAVVDVWDALNTDRPYRHAWPREKVIEYLGEQAGKHFDPQVLQKFLELIDSDEFIS